MKEGLILFKKSRRWKFNKRIIILFILILFLTTEIRSTEAKDSWEYKKDHIGVIIDPGHGIRNLTDPKSADNNSFFKETDRGTITVLPGGIIEFSPTYGKAFKYSLVGGAFNVVNRTESDYSENEGTIFFSRALKENLSDVSIRVFQTRDLDNDFNTMLTDPVLGVRHPNENNDWRHGSAAYIPTSANPRYTGKYNHSNVATDHINIRWDYANQLQRDDNETDYVFISYHSNALDPPAGPCIQLVCQFASIISRGTETWYSSGTAANPKPSDLKDSTRFFAESIHNLTVKQIKKSIPNWNNRGVLDAGGAFAVVRETKIPAIIMEIAFHTNRNDLEFLNYSNRTAKYIVANGTFEGIKKYFNSSVNSTNSTGSDTNFFPIGNTLYVMGTNNSKDRQMVYVHVTKHRDYLLNDPNLDDWNRTIKFDDVDLINITAQTDNNEYLSDITTIAKKIVKVGNISFPGKFDIVVSIFNHTHFQYVDALDNLTGEPSSIVSGVEPGFIAPGVYPTNESGDITKNFIGWNKDASKVYFKAEYLPKNKNVDVYVVQYDSGRNWDNLDLNNININKTTVPTDNDGNISNTPLWDIRNTSDMNVFNRTGRFNIVIDVDRDGFFNLGKDIIDKNEVGVLKSFVDTHNVLTRANYNIPNNNQNNNEGKHATVELKAFLHEYINSSIEINTTFDQQTEYAVKKYQKLKKTTGDTAGEIGPNTFSRIADDANISFRVAVVSPVNNTNNITRYFPYSSKINATALGLPPSIPNRGNPIEVDVYIVNYTHTDWTKEKFLDDIKVIDKKTLMTNESGNFTKEEVWNPINEVKKILDNNGRFHLVIDVDQDKFYNVSRDIVDNVTSPPTDGFRVGYANSSNITDSFADIFTNNSTIKVRGVGFPLGKVKISVVKDRNWDEGENISDLDPLKTSDFFINNDGSIKTEVWNDSKPGKYDIIIDVNHNGRYDRDVDVVDGLSDIGFIVLGCGKEICSLINSVDTTGNHQNIFDDFDNIDAKGFVISKTDKIGKLVVVKSASPIEDRNGHPLIDVSGGSEEINLPANQLVEINQTIWPQGDNPLGDYELILDNGDGKFNISEDGYDPDGFGITREIIAPKFALDSEGNIHVVALLDWELNKTSNYWERKVVYGKIPADADYKIDIDHPELFNWSEAQTVTDFKTIYSTSQGTTRIGNPDIAVDKNNEPHIAFGISLDRGEFEWIIYIKLDKNGDRDIWADSTLGETATNPQCKPQSDGKYLCPGDGQDGLMYYWGTFTDVKLLFPKIAIVNGTVPVILTEVDFTLPNMYYMTELFPKYLSVKFVPEYSLYQLGGVVSNQPPILFTGTSLEVAIKNLKPGDRDGSIVWPGNEKYSPEASSRFNLAKSSMSLTEDLTYTIRLDDWVYMPVDEYSKDFPSLTFHNYNLQAENDKIHVVYSRSDKQNNILSGPKRLYYQTIDVSGLNLSEGIDDQKRDILYNLDPDDQQNWRIPVPGTEKQILKESEGGYPANGALPELDVDSRGIVHIVWQSGDKIYYATYDPAAKSILDYKVIASIKDDTFQAKPGIALDSQDNPHVTWVDRESQEPLNGTIFYMNGNNVNGVTDFSDKLEIVNSTVYSPENPFFDNSQVLTNKNSNDDWTDRVYVGWLDLNPYDKQRLIKVKKTMPHVTALLLIDGIDSAFLEKNLQNMPNLKKLINDNHGINAATFSSLPATTMSSQAELFTGLKPHKNHVIGDNFQYGNDLFNFYSDKDYTDIQDINGFLNRKGIMTLFDALNNVHKSASAIPSIYTQGIVSSRPDSKVQANGNFYSGIAFDSNQISMYLRDLKNNDNKIDNDVTDLLVAYINTHDHGINANPGDIDFVKIDNKIGEIINAFKKNGIFNDTIFVVTSDHGFVDTIKDDEHSLDNSDLSNLTNPDGISPSELFLNGRFVYSYSDNPTQEARLFYNNSMNETSEWFGSIDRILIKDGGVYNDYSFDGTDDLLVPANDQFLKDLTFEGSPSIILIARSDEDPEKNYYFQKPQEAIYGDQMLLPLIVTGKGFSSFSRGNNELPSEIPMVDVGPTTAFFTAGQKAVDLMTGIDGKNTYKPELTVRGGSPVYFHLYDSRGRHVGPDGSGNIEHGIPGSNYEVDKITGKKSITLLQAPDQYRVEVESYGYGAFGLYIEMNKRNESFTVEYPRTSISADSSGEINLTVTFDIQLDFDGDGTFEKTIMPIKVVTVNQDEENNTAAAKLVRIPADDSVIIDTLRATDTQLDITTHDPVNDGSINLEKIFDTALDSPGFFTLGSFARINFTDNVLGSSKQIKLTIDYPDYVLIPKGLSEKSLSIYEKGTHTRINSTVDLDLNRVTAVIDRSGDYVLASTDLAPGIENITVEPKITRIPQDNVKVSARITDNGAVTNASVTLHNATGTMLFNPSSGLYEASITALKLLAGTR